MGEEGEYSTRSTGLGNVFRDKSGSRLETSNSHAWVILSWMGDRHITIMSLKPSFSDPRASFRLTKLAVVRMKISSSFEGENQAVEVNDDDDAIALVGSGLDLSVDHTSVKLRSSS